ncbi:virB8 family protein [Aminobacter sp. MET-1]|uniref:virB8 family protein n=1 Tax=Aminobacter sp. MET-1 TaxID=2951085 RepID=UPI002269DF20|nr:type IV secretion system protein [Aminobacter sp. MET-1]MCX8571133.1 type IV secretion system protein [Aminobacter sp. MET-1]MCX8573198.1 type IV secretion system protein [Aminobacter sp. MET-1]
MAWFKKKAATEPEGKVAGPEEIYQQHQTWGARQKSLMSLLAVALAAAGAAGWVVAGISVYASSQLFPLKTVEVVPLIVDKNTGYMETVTTLEKDKSVSELQAVRASFVGNYVIKRESYDPRYVADAFDTIAIWSDPNGKAYRDYEDLMNPGNPRSPIKEIGAQGDIKTNLLSVNPLNDTTMNVRFETEERRQGGMAKVDRWSATVRFRRANLEMNQKVRLLNPLGFVVTDYTKVPEMMPSGLPQ